MAGRLLKGLGRSKDPKDLVQQCHQAFLKMPFEANPERVAEEIARLLHSMKVRRDGEVAAPLSLLLPGVPEGTMGRTRCSRRAAGRSGVAPERPPPLPPPPHLRPPALNRCRCRPQDAMFGEESDGQHHSNKEAAVMIAYAAVETGLLTDMVSYLGARTAARCRRCGDDGRGMGGGGRRRPWLAAPPMLCARTRHAGV